MGVQVETNEIERESIIQSRSLTFHAFRYSAERDSICSVMMTVILRYTNSQNPVQMGTHTSTPGVHGID